MIAGHRLLARQHDAGLQRVLADVLAIIWSTLMPPWMIGALCDRHARRAGCRSAPGGCPAGGGLVEQAVDDVDLVFSGSSGAGVLLSSISAPEPLAHQ